MADISKIRLPSGNEYDIKDTVARQLISGGVSFNIVWSQDDYTSTTAPDAAKLATIPEGIQVLYNNGASMAVGTLVAQGDAAESGYTPGFYLVYSNTQADGIPTGDPKDRFDEYVAVRDPHWESGQQKLYRWEKIGDTLINLSNVVTSVTLSKQTDTAIGTDATFTVTQPTISLAKGGSGTGKVSVVTGVNSVTQPTISLSGESSSASGRAQFVQSLTTQKLSANVNDGAIDWDDQDLKTVLTGVTVTKQPDVELTSSATSTTGSIPYVSALGAATTTALSAEVQGGGVGWGSKDSVTAITGVTDTTTKLKASASVSGKTGSVIGTVTPSSQKLATTSITGVSGSTNITPVESRSSQTTATGSWTAVAASETDANNNSNPDVNENLLANISVSNEILSIGAATLNTQTTYSAGAPRASLAVPTAASATTVATGSLTSSGSGSSVITAVETTPSTVVTAAPTVTLSSGTTGDVTVMTGTTTSNDTVVGTDATLTHTNPTVTLVSGTTGDVTVATSGGTATTKYLTATAKNTAVGANGTAQVVGKDSTFTYIGPSVDISAGPSGDVDVVTSGTTKYMAATASGGAVDLKQENVGGEATGGNVAWNNKDSITVLTNATSLNVTRGN